jgi:DUF1365 family protein
MNRSAIASFREEHHMKAHMRPGKRLGEAVRDAVEAETGARPADTARIMLLTHLSYFGYVFNPVSFYFIYDPSTGNRRVSTVLAEVSNTPWNEMHLYVLPTGEAARAAIALAAAAAGETGGAAAAEGAASTTTTTAAARRPGTMLLESTVTEEEKEEEGESAPSPSSSSSAALLEARLKADGATNPATYEALPTAFLQAPAPYGAAAAGTTTAGGGGGVGSLPPSTAPSAAVVRAPAADRGGHRRLRFRWLKTFHVSPFMEMRHVYDWVFSEPGETLLVQSQNSQAADGLRMFTTQLRLLRVPGPEGTGRLTFGGLAWAVFFAFPILTWRVQAWIHVEAFRLWWKGVPFVPHPTGASNGFTRLVSAVMTPVMAVSDWWSGGNAAAAVAGVDEEGRGGKEKGE